MNEKENNAVELKDPQLKQVTGGNVVFNPGMGGCYASFPDESTPYIGDCANCCSYSSCQNTFKNTSRESSALNFK